MSFRSAIREATLADEVSFRRRITSLAAIYLALFCVSVMGIAVLLSNGRLFIALAQRSNVETLTLAFFLVIFAYMGALSAPGAWGAARLLWLRTVLGSTGSERRERWLQARCRHSNRETSAVFNRLIEAKDRPDEPILISLRDAFGAVGSLSLDGARIAHLSRFREGSNTLLGFVEQKLNALLQARGEEKARVNIVAWANLDDEGADQYASLVEFARALERKLEAPFLWPRVSLTKHDLDELERSVCSLCPDLRSEALLPDWEYEGEHKIPIIPEPLGIISLSRREQRVDPVASMASALAFSAFLWISFFPPWVPGS